MKVIILLALVFVLSCHRQDPRGDTVAPWIKQITPETYVVKERELTFCFSENIYPDSVKPEHILCVRREDVNDDLMSDFSNINLQVKHIARTLPIDIQLSQANCIKVTLPQNIEDGEYTVLLSPEIRDLSLNPLVDEKGIKAIKYHHFSFESPLYIKSYSWDAQEIQPQSYILRMTFSGKIDSFRADGIVLKHEEDILKPKFIELNASHDQARIEWPKGSILPGHLYELFVSAIAPDTGQPQEFRLPVQVGSSRDANVQENLNVRVVASEEQADLIVDVKEPGELKMWFGDDEQITCAGQPCPTTQVASSATPTVMSLRGLSLNKTYYYTIRFENDLGDYKMAMGSFITMPLPKVAINEIMTNPKMATDDKKSAGEFIELANFGPTDISLKGWKLEVGNRSCQIPVSDTSSVLKPQSFMVLAGQFFREGYYKGLSPSKVVRMTTKELCGGLRKASGQKIRLLDDEGRVVSSYGGYIISRYPGNSIERIRPDIPDEENGFCLSVPGIGPTPGKENGVYLKGCSSKR